MRFVIAVTLCVVATGATTAQTINLTLGANPETLADIAKLPDDTTSVSLSRFRGPPGKAIMTLVRLPKLKELSLWSFPATDSDVAYLPKLTALKALHLFGRSVFGGWNRLTDKGLAHIGRCKTLKTLTAWGLSVSDAGAKQLSNLKNLERLDLSYNNITGKGLGHLAELTKLRDLRLSYNKINGADLVHLARLTKLERLDLNDTAPLTDEGLLHISKLHRLRRLQLPENTPGVTDRGLDALKALTELTSLRLVKSKYISDDGLAALAALPKLEHLVLYSLPRVTDQGLAVFSKLPRLKNLELAELRGVGGGGLKHVAGLKRLERLMIWSLGNVQPNAWAQLGGLNSLRYLRTNHDLNDKALASIGRLENLEDLNVRLSKITDNGLAHLTQAPKLKSLWLASPLLTKRSLLSLRKMKSLRILCINKQVPLDEADLVHLGKVALNKCRISRDIGRGRVIFDPAKR